jgi:hypothetical protein
MYGAQGRPSNGKRRGELSGVPLQEPLWRKLRGGGYGGSYGGGYSPSPAPSYRASSGRGASNVRAK